MPKRRLEDVLMTYLLAAIPVTGLSDPVGSTAGQGDDILAALDLISTGM
jgi:hypothetical protein